MQKPFFQEINAELSISSDVALYNLVINTNLADVMYLYNPLLQLTISKRLC